MRVGLIETLTPELVKANAGPDKDGNSELFSLLMAALANTQLPLTTGPEPPSTEASPTVEGVQALLARLPEGISVEQLLISFPKELAGIDKVLSEAMESEESSETKALAQSKPLEALMLADQVPAHETTEPKAIGLEKEDGQKVTLNDYETKLEEIKPLDKSIDFKTANQEVRPLDKPIDFKTIDQEVKVLDKPIDLESAEQRVKPQELQVNAVTERPFEQVAVASTISVNTQPSQKPENLVTASHNNIPEPLPAAQMTTFSQETNELVMPPSVQPIIQQADNLMLSKLNTGYVEPTSRTTPEIMPQTSPAITLPLTQQPAVQISTETLQQLRTEIISFTNNPVRPSITLEIAPPEYGRVMVSAEQSAQGQVTINLVVETQAAKDAVVQQLPQALSNATTTPTTIAVFTADEYEQYQQKDQDRNQGRQQRGKQRQQEQAKQPQQVEFVI